MSLLAISCLSSCQLGIKEGKDQKLSAEKGNMGLPSSRAVVATTGHSSLIPLSCWMAVMRFLGALGAYSKQGLGVSLQNFSTSQQHCWFP